MCIRDRYTVTAPSAPTGMAATVISVNEVDLAWTDTAPSTDNAGEAGSYIVLEKIGSGSYNAIDTIHSNTIDSYQVTNLTPNTSYTFEVEANNTAGTSSPDASSAVTTQNNAVPTGVVSGVGVTVSGSTFNVTWSNTVSGATGYYVESVSYTHLDVYKRQDRWGPPGFTLATSR